MFNVIVNLSPLDGYSWKDLELDSPDDLGDHYYKVMAETEEEAKEKALDIFHNTVPIGVLDLALVDTTVSLTSSNET